MTIPNGPQENPNESPEQAEKVRNKIHLGIRDLMKKEYSETKANREKLTKILKKDNQEISEIKDKIEKEIIIPTRKNSLLNWEVEVESKLDRDGQIEQTARNILSDRSRDETNAENKLKKWFAPLSDADKNQWKHTLETLNSSELSLALKSAEKMKEVFVAKNNANENIFQEKNVPNIAEKILNHLSDDVADSLRQNPDFNEKMQFFAQYGRMDENMIGTILEKIKEGNFADESERRDALKKIIAIIFPTVTFAMVKKYQLASVTEIENFENTIKNTISNKIFAKNYSTLTDEEKNQIDEISIDTLKIEEFDAKKLDATKLDEELIQNINNKTHQIHEDLKNIIKEQNLTYEKYLDDEKEKVNHIGDMKIWLKKHLTREQKWKIVGGDSAIDSIGEGKFLKYTQKNGQRNFFKIVKDDTIMTEGVEQAGITIQRYALTQTGDMFAWQTAEEPDPRTFQNFIDIFVAQLKSSNNEKIEITDDVDAPERGTEILGIQTLDEVKEIINDMDKDGVDKGFEPGLTFSVEVEDDKWNRKSEMVTLLDTSGGLISMRLFDGQRVDVSYHDFVEQLDHENMNIRRLGDVSSAENFVKNGAVAKRTDGENSLTKIPGLKFKDGKVMMEGKIPENLGEYFDTSKLTEKEKEKLTEKEQEVWGFKNEKKNIFINVEFNVNGSVTATIWDYKMKKERDPDRYSDETLKNLSKKEKEKREKEAKQIKKEGKQYKNLTYATLLQILQDKGATEPIPKKQTVETYDKKWNITEKEMDPLEAYEADLAFQNGEHMKDKKSSPVEFITIGTLYYGAKHIIDYHKKKWEHKSEVKSAYAFMRLNKYLGSGGVDAMSRLINTTKDDLKNRYKGKNMREYIDKNILKNNNARPHEVLAALMITVEMAGHLYPDSSLQDHLSKNYIWFNKVCHAIGVEPKSAFKKCYEKTAQDNDKLRDYVAEEDLITRLFKINQGLDMVQAIGGGAPFWKAAEGTKDDQASKWEKEVTDFSNELSRAGYAVSKMESNEYEIALGAIPKIFDKWASPKAMVPFFVVAATNATNYVNNATLDKFQSFQYKSITFHATPFCRNKDLADTYKDTIEIALRKKTELKKDPYGAIYHEYLDLYTDVKKAGHKHNPDLIKKANSFWLKHADSLQQLLQGVDPILQVSMTDPNTSEKDRNTIRKYLQTMHGTAMAYPGMGGLKAQKDHHSLLETYGMKSSNPFLSTSEENSIYKSLALSLDALEIEPVNKKMSGASRYAALQVQIIEYFKVIRDNDTFQANPAYQKKQFKISYNEMMKKLLEKTWPITREEFEWGKHDDLKHFALIEKQLGIKMDFDTFEKVRNSRGKLSFADLVDQDPDIFNNFLNSARSGSQFLRQRISKATHDLTFDQMAR